MLKTTLALLSFTVSLSAFSEELKCYVSDGNGKILKKGVPVNVQKGAWRDPESEIKKEQIADHSFTVIYDLGDEYERQTRLDLIIDDSISRVYNVSELTLYSLIKTGASQDKSVTLDCSFRIRWF